MTELEESYFAALGLSSEKELWYWEKYIVMRDKYTEWELKIKNYLLANNLGFLHKVPVVCKNGKVYFVDFYIPDYSLILDIEKSQYSKYQTQKSVAVRKLDLQTVPGKHCHIIKYKDILKDDFRCGISGALLSGFDRRSFISRKKGNRKTPRG